MTNTFWDRMLLVSVALVALYASAMVVAGLWVGDTLFDLLGFGPDDGGITDDVGRDYLRLVYAMLGAVIVGWMALLVAVVAGPLRRREPWAWGAVVASMASWFVLDTGMSLVLGFVGHAAFNLGFIAAVGVPLIVIRQELTPSG